MLGRQHLELRDQPTVTADRELGLDALLDRRQAQLLEPLDVHTRKRLELQIGQRPPAPQTLGLAERPRRGIGITRLERPPPILDQILEAPQVELPGRNVQDVTRRPRDQRRPTGAVRAERLAQARHVDLQRVARRRGRIVSPQLLDQPIPRHDPIGAQQQDREQRALLRSPQREPPAVRVDRQRAKDAKVHYKATLSRSPAPQEDHSGTGPKGTDADGPPPRGGGPLAREMCVRHRAGPPLGALRAN